MKVTIYKRADSFYDPWIIYYHACRILYKIVDCYDSALEHAGMTVFPNFKTGWHFDDKLTQKYLFEAISSFLMPSYVFYDRKEAINSVKSTKYTKASNVELIENFVQTRKFIDKGVGKYFSQYNGWSFLKERYRKCREGREHVLELIKGIARLFIVSKFAKIYSRAKGCVYFQDFIPNNDTRNKVIGQKYAYGN